MPVLSPKNSTPDPGFGIYFHWPFCRKKCPYCDFNSHVRESLDEQRWVTALISELDYYSALSDKTEVTSIFFGGGTPSLMSDGAVAELISAVGDRFDLSPNVEISLEANPTSAEASSFAGYRLAGVNRLSMGVQSLQDKFLKFLGREHSVAEAMETIEIARANFENISFDLIYALPDQSLQDWEQDLKQALTLAGDHISLYQLTIEPNTGFAGSYRRGEFALPVDELAEDMFALTQDICQQQGLEGYEISNHARPGYECRHNLTYWRYGGYLGIGPGAHGRLIAGGKRYATSQLRKPETWLQQVEAHGHATESSEEVVEALDKAEELLLMGLRLKEGVWFENVERLTSSPFSELVDASRLQKLLGADYLGADEQRIWATDQGRFVLNSVLAELLS
ncbi:radical SAM family heme chaperone HemW [Sneathiella limimaris]|uniref:radical SAM family heme chaperone HemW n=1 Tax=Sneathiella limimaris TaxID=1964213 RepID=UPI00146CC74C|nr:radical SAM family heme chaperone HemW [Sneathiella limimaris]